MMPSGLIDFGDLVSTYRISDIATAAQSLMLHAPAAGAARSRSRSRAGSTRSSPLDEDEVEAIWALVLARAAVIAVCEEHQAALEPDNPYAQEALDDGWGVADGLEAVAPALAREVLRARARLRALGRARGPRRGRVAALATERVGAALDRGARGGRSTSRCAATSCASATGSTPSAVAALLTAAGPGAVGRWGEARLIHAAPEVREPPADRAPGRRPVRRAGDARGGPARRRPSSAPGAGDRDRRRRHRACASPAIVPAVAAGDVLAGRRRGRHGRRARPTDDPLPAHVHVQALARSAARALPGWPGRPRPPAGVRCAPTPPCCWASRPRAPRQRPGARWPRRRDRVFATRPGALLRGGAADRARLAPASVRHRRPCRTSTWSTTSRSSGTRIPASRPRSARQLRLLNTNSRFHYELLVEFCERLAAADAGRARRGAARRLRFGGERRGPAARALRDRAARRADDPERLPRLDGRDRRGVDLGLRQPAGRRAPAAVDPPDREPEHLPRRGIAGPARACSTRRMPTVRWPRSPLRATASPGSSPRRCTGTPAAFRCPDGYLEHVYGAVRAAGGLCIADEVQVGYGRLGSFFWGFEQQGVVPDVITIAKATGNGFPVGAVITTRAIAEAFEREGAFFSSTGGSPASCAVGARGPRRAPGRGPAGERAARRRAICARAWRSCASATRSAAPCTGWASTWGSS